MKFVANAMAPLLVNVQDAQIQAHYYMRGPVLKFVPKKLTKITQDALLATKIVCPVLGILPILALPAFQVCIFRRNLKRATEHAHQPPFN